MRKSPMGFGCLKNHDEGALFDNAQRADCARMGPAVKYGGPSARAWERWPRDFREGLYGVGCAQ